MKNFNLTLIVATAAATNPSILKFTQFLAEHGKNYATADEFMFRLEQFIITEKEIFTFNSKPGQTSRVAHNKFSDWS